jgi:hypothetical protein
VSLSSRYGGDRAPRPGDGQGSEASRPQPDELAQIERNLTLTFSERLDQLVRTVAFIHAGRAALARRDE